jgi:hypothetical protein
MDETLAQGYFVSSFFVLTINDKHCRPGQAFRTGRGPTSGRKTPTLEHPYGY